MKFYADGWLIPRACAMWQPFADRAEDGLLFMDAATLARRIEPFADRGWRIATQNEIAAYHNAGGNQRFDQPIAKPWTPDPDAAIALGE